MRRALWVIGSVACSSSGGLPGGGLPPDGTGEADVRPTAVPAPSAGIATAGPGASVVGSWRSPSCGTRSYPRELEFFPDGRFTARDLVSPCPAGVSCVWSGVVDRGGRFSVDGARLELVVEQGETARGGQALSTTLTLTGGAPVEEGGCVYVAAP
jgi:hypothetical protein